ncbi:tubulin-folding cofactor B [Condylostylus longicornis]|uniref:tubulin-folding cofactor B n=1 Tax=Condylostylus longicornis TaxID=2530218 RepID=UPI00244DDFDB|nr:tubulin-folding cofactor B [Condylostylus longicornis]
MSDFVKINISNSKNDTVSFEKRFPKSLSVLEFKEKLEIITGGSASSMQLELFKGDKLVCKIDNNEALLGSYPIDDDMRVHVTNDIIFIAEQVEKFELTDQQYEQREDSLKNFLKKNKMGKYNEEEMKKIEEKKKQAAEEEKLKAESCKIGSRCKVQVKGKPTRLGTVMYNGELEGKKGIFIGVKYDEPLGTNNGSVDGKSYFECEEKYGGFVAPGCIEIGDFPPEEDELDEI